MLWTSAPGETGRRYEAKVLGGERLVRRCPTNLSGRKGLRAVERRPTCDRRKRAGSGPTELASGRIEVRTAEAESVIGGFGKKLDFIAAMTRR
jgi:hypothetical protein